MNIEKWKICSNCKCKIDFKISIRLSESKDDFFYTRKDYFNLCIPCFNKLIPNTPKNQYKPYPRHIDKICNTCGKQLNPTTEYYKTSNTQYTFSLWDWDTYRVNFCSDCIYPYKKFMKKENIVSEYAHINYRPKDHNWGRY